MQETTRSRWQIIIMWGAICEQDKVPHLYVYATMRATMDSHRYTTKILDSHFIPFWHRMCEEKG